jgi:MFS family permease
LNNIDDDLSENQSIMKDKLKTYTIAAANAGGQQFYWNYATLIAVGIGATPIQMSFITAIQNLGQSLFQGFFGRLSDRFGRKLVLLIGFIIATITTVNLVFLTSPVIFMIIIAFYSIGISMIIPSWNALMGDITTEKTRSKVISQLSMVGTLTSSGLLLLLGFIIDFIPFKNTELEAKYRVMVFVASLFFALASVLILTLSETNRQKIARKSIPIRTLARNRSFVIFSGATWIYFLAMSLLWPLSPFVLSRLEPSTAAVAILSAVFSASMALGFIITIKIAEKIGRRRMIFIGFMSLCLVPITLAYSTHWALIIITNFFGGLGNGLVNVSLNTEILNLAEPEIKGTYSGTYNLFMGILTFTGSFVSGLIFEHFTKADVSLITKSLHSDFSINLLAKFIDLSLESFDLFLRNFLIIITCLRILASIPIFILALKEKRKQ